MIRQVKQLVDASSNPSYTRSILIVEDEEDLQLLLRYHLEQHQYKVQIASCAEEAYDKALQNPPDLFLLDWMLPDFSGYELCIRLRHHEKFQHTPIMMITAKSEEENIISALQKAGADDYVTKPYSIKTLLARIEALMRRSQYPQSLDKTHEDYTYQEFRLSSLTHQIFYKEQLLKLSPIEYKLLSHLLRHPGKVFSREQLIEGALPLDHEIEPRSVDTYIKRIRKALSDCGTRDDIQTLRGVGYLIKS